MLTRSKTQGNFRPTDYFKISEGFRTKILSKRRELSQKLLDPDVSHPVFPTNQLIGLVQKLLITSTLPISALSPDGAEAVQLSDADRMVLLFLLLNTQHNGIVINCKNSMLRQFTGLPKTSVNVSLQRLRKHQIIRHTVSGVRKNIFIAGSGATHVLNLSHQFWGDAAIFGDFYVFPYKTKTPCLAALLCDTILEQQDQKSIAQSSNSEFFRDYFFSLTQAEYAKMVESIHSAITMLTDNTESFKNFRTMYSNKKPICVEVSATEETSWIGFLQKARSFNKEFLDTNLYDSVALLLQTVSEQVACYAMQYLSEQISYLRHQSIYKPSMVDIFTLKPAIQYVWHRQDDWSDHPELVQLICCIAFYTITLLTRIGSLPNQPIQWYKGPFSVIPFQHTYRSAMVIYIRHNQKNQFIGEDRIHTFQRDTYQNHSWTSSPFKGQYLTDLQ